MESFSERFSTALKDSGLKEADLAKIIGVSQQTINNWKLGKTGSKRMYEAARVLRVNAAWLIEGRGPRERQPEKAPVLLKLLDLISSLSPEAQESLIPIAKVLKDSDKKSSE